MTSIHLAQGATIPARFLNRHGLITGPTGTGKTVSLMRLAEQISRANSPVFAVDVKGDIAAIARSCPTQIIDPLAIGIPVWAFDPDLLARALQLSEAQGGCLSIAFAHADETQARLDTLQDLRALLATLAAKPDSVRHLGHVTRASVGTIQRALLALESQGCTRLFSASRFDLESVLTSGRVTILDASRLINSPALYGAFMLHLMRELSERLPEAGDLDRPRLVLIIDEAHCLFHEASPALLRQAESTARLIRSKGVGLFFASQSPDDLPRLIREQCSTTIAHDRALGVGVARFQTLTATGAQTRAAIIRPALPECALGALSQAESAALRPALAVPAQTPATWQDMTWHGYAFLAFAALAVIGLGAFTWHIVAAGKIGGTLALLGGMAWAARR